MKALSIEEAIRQAADTRLRPILMTNITALVGALPLIFTPVRAAKPAAYWGDLVFRRAGRYCAHPLCGAPGLPPAGAFHPIPFSRNP